MTGALPSARRPRIATWILIALLSPPVFYLGSYSALSLTGNYVGFQKAGAYYRVWYPFGFHAPDDGSARAIAANLLTTFYRPCLRLDHRHWHRHR